MILKREIENQAEKNIVAKSTIDKDWVLGHFIDAIFSIAVCKKNLIFKAEHAYENVIFLNIAFLKISTLLVPIKSLN